MTRPKDCPCEAACACPPEPDQCPMTPERAMSDLVLVPRWVFQDFLDNAPGWPDTARRYLAASPVPMEALAWREALEPFAAFARFDEQLTAAWPGRVPNADGDAVLVWNGGFGLKGPKITYGDIRKALAVIPTQGGEGPAETKADS